MKSERAKQFIKEHEWMDTEVGTTATYSVYACNAVELAEQEAEERMRKRAAKAYCDECCWAAGTACEREVAHCAFLRAFTKKLNGE